MDIGLKISVPTKDVKTAGPKDLLVDSAYSMLKYHSDTIGSVTFNPGDTDQHVDFPHTLGYVPAFISYLSYNGLHFISLPSSGAAGLAQHAYAYADSAKIRCGYHFDVGAFNQYHTNANDWFDNSSGVRGFLVIGNGGAFGGSRSGALRFGGVTVPHGTTIVSATLTFAVNFKGTGSGDLLIKTVGIAEDNTGDFSSSPMARAQTTSQTTQSVALGPAGSDFGINVTSQVQEILNRSGWSSGNNMGFLIFDNGTPTNVFAEDDSGTGEESQLTINLGGSQVLTFRTIIFKDKLA